MDNWCCRMEARVCARVLWCGSIRGCKWLCPLRELVATYVRVEDSEERVPQFCGGSELHRGCCRESRSPEHSSPYSSRPGKKKPKLAPDSRLERSMTITFHRTTSRWHRHADRSDVSSVVQSTRGENEKKKMGRHDTEVIVVVMGRSTGTSRVEDKRTTCRVKKREEEEKKKDKADIIRSISSSCRRLGLDLSCSSD